MHGKASCTDIGGDLGGHTASFLHDGRQLILQSCVANGSVSRTLPFGLDNQTAVDFIQLDSDGSLRGYTYDYGNATWRAVYDWFANRSGDICGQPNICGPYGICRYSSSTNWSHNECSCPSTSSSQFDVNRSQPFLPVNKSDSRQGCRLAHPLNCTLNEPSLYFIELQGVNYFANDVLSSQRIANKTKQQCVAACAQKCACKAAFYRSDVGACFLYEQVLSIMGPGTSTPLHSTLFNYKQISMDTSGKVSASSKTFASGKHEVTQTQLAQISVPLNSSNLAHVHSGNALAGYVCYLKVHNDSAPGGVMPSEAGDPRYLMIILGSAIGGLVLLFVTCALFCVCCKKTRRFKALGNEDFFMRTLSGQHMSIVQFTFDQLQEATGDFKSKLGLGGFGSVYKGTLPNGSVVAIKQLESAIRCQKEFECQVLHLNSLNHPNLVSLVGLCTGGSRRFIVSEYMVNGSLDAWIFNQQINEPGDAHSLPSPSLDWATRFGIALDVAKGLAFLHESNLIHLYVKPQNILLDDNFVAKLSDYGLSRLMDQEEGCMIMHMRGTTGYMAPEWIQHACATQKSDVYSYGMVLMEMLGGRKNVDLSKERESWYFPTVAAKIYKEGRMLEVLDEKLTRGKAMGKAECEQARMVMQVAFWCIAENPSKRPDMGSVILMLQGQQEVQEPPLPLHFGGLSVHNSMCGDDDSQQFCNHGYYNQSGCSSPTCFNISYAVEPLPTLGLYGSWPNGGNQSDDCSSLLTSHD